MALVLGGIYAGVFPPSAAGAVGAAGALVLALGMRRIGRSGIWDSLLESARVSATLFLIVMAGLLFSRFLLVSGFMAELKSVVLAMEMGAATFIAIVIVLYLVLGCFVDSVSLMVITIPFLHPIGQSIGIDGIWFGVLVIKLVEIAAITPPVGLNLFAVLAAARGKLNSRELFMGILPFLAMEAVILGLLLAFPAISTWLPRMMD